MIIEYRTTDPKDQYGFMASRVKRTYKDVKHVVQNGTVTYLYGIVPGEWDTKRSCYASYAQEFLIAAINLALGEYLEVVDVPRD